MSCLFLFPLVFILISSNCFAETIKSRAALTLDASTGEILFSKNPNLRLPPASTTKLMTAIVAIENENLSKVVTISKNASHAVPSKVGFKKGDRITIEGLLYAALLESANDAAVALAEAIAGSEKRFVSLMNQKAFVIGAKDTRFINPNGLPGSGQYTTALNLSKILNYALKIPKLREIIGTTEAQITTESGRIFYLKSTDQLLWSDEKVIGGKTGYTQKAGHCFVGAAQREAKTIVVAVLGSPSRKHLWADTEKLISENLQGGSAMGISFAIAGEAPASKAAAKISKFVALYSSCTADSDVVNPDVCRDDTGWETIHTLYIKTANQKDLAINTAFECGLMTFTGGASKNGDMGIALATGRILVRVAITDVDNALKSIGTPVRYAEPSGGFASGFGEGEGIVYCSRPQALAAQFGDYGCTPDLETETVTCDDPELVALLLKTLEGSAFNFMAANEPPGIKKIEVQGRGQALDAAFSFGLDARTKAFSEAFVGAGSTQVEEIRLIKSVEIVQLP